MNQNKLSVVSPILWIGDGLEGIGADGVEER
jgi:hypothetical protein